MVQMTLKLQDLPESVLTKIAYEVGKKYLNRNLAPFSALPLACTCVSLRKAVRNTVTVLHFGDPHAVAEVVFSLRFAGVYLREVRFANWYFRDHDVWHDDPEWKLERLFMAVYRAEQFRVLDLSLIKCTSSEQVRHFELILCLLRNTIEELIPPNASEPEYAKGVCDAIRKFLLPTLKKVSFHYNSKLNPEHFFEALKECFAPITHLNISILRIRGKDETPPALDYESASTKSDEENRNSVDEVDTHRKGAPAVDGEMSFTVSSAVPQERMSESSTGLESTGRASEASSEKMDAASKGSGDDADRYDAVNDHCELSRTLNSNSVKPSAACDGSDKIRATPNAAAVDDISQSGDTSDGVTERMREPLLPNKLLCCDEDSKYSVRWDEFSAGELALLALLLSTRKTFVELTIHPFPWQIEHVLRALSSLLEFDVRVLNETEPWEGNVYEVLLESGVRVTELDASWSRTYTPSDTDVVTPLLQNNADHLRLLAMRWFPEAAVSSSPIHLPALRSLKVTTRPTFSTTRTLSSMYKIITGTSWPPALEELDISGLEINTEDVEAPVKFFDAVQKTLTRLSIALIPWYVCNWPLSDEGSVCQESCNGRGVISALGSVQLAGLVYLSICGVKDPFYDVIEVFRSITALEVDRNETQICTPKVEELSLNDVEPRCGLLSPPNNHTGTGDMFHSVTKVTVHRKLHFGEDAELEELLEVLITLPRLRDLALLNCTIGLRTMTILRRAILLESLGLFRCLLPNGEHGEGSWCRVASHNLIGSKAILDLCTRYA